MISNNKPDSLRKFFIGIIIMNAIIGFGDLVAAVIFIWKRAIEQFISAHNILSPEILTSFALSSDSHRFAIFYFISHGIIKLGLAGALLKNKLWAYPIAIIFFGCFSLYQIYILLGHYSIFELILFFVNATVLVSVTLEYRRITQTKAL